MSLTDALLLDPYPFEVWIAFRTDGIPQRASDQLGHPVLHSALFHLLAHQRRIAAASSAGVGLRRWSSK
jgi:hypothetical protein